MKTLSHYFRRTQVRGIVLILCVLALLAGGFWVPRANAVATITGTAPTTASWSLSDEDGYIKDPARVESALADCGSVAGNCKLALVANFSESNVEAAAQAFRKDKDLGTSDLMLFISVEKRKFTYIIGPQVDLYENSKARLNHETKPILSQAVASGDWDQAGISVAKIMKQALTPGTGSSSGTEPQKIDLDGKNGHSSRLGAASILILGNLFVGFVAFMILWIVIRIFKKKRRKQRDLAKGSPDTAGLSIEELGKQANTALLNVDNGLRDAEEELEYDRLQFGRTATDEFERVIANAKPRIADAWKTLSRTYSETDENVRRELFEKIIRIATDVDGSLGAQQGAFSKLRTTISEVPNEIPAMRQRLEELSADEDLWNLQLQTLHTTFPHTPMASLEAIPERIKTLLQASRTALDEAQQALERNESTQSQHRLQLAQRTYTQALGLKRQLDEADQTLSHIQDLLVTAITSISSDIQDAQKLAPEDEALDPFVTEAKLAISQAHKARNAAQDPFEALNNLTSAEASLDTALAPFRKAEDVKKRQISTISTKVAAVQAKLDRAHGYLQMNRGVANSSARSQLAAADHSMAEVARKLTDNPQEAEADLVQAETAADNVIALISKQLDFAQSQRGRYSSTSEGERALDFLSGLFYGGISNGNSRHSWGSSDTSWGSDGLFSSSGDNDFGSFGGGSFGGGSFGGGFSSTGGSSF